MLREGTAAGRCKHSAPAAHYCRAKPPGGAYVQGTGSGTKRAAVRRRRRLQSAHRLPHAPQRMRHAAAAAARAHLHQKMQHRRLATPPSRAPSRHRGSKGNASSPPRFSVEDKLKEIVAEQLGVEQSSITPEASFASDLGADSLDVVEMVMKIEEEFNVELPDERAEEVQNLSDAVRVVTELTA